MNGSEGSAFDLLYGLDAVHPGHHDVEQHEIRPKLADLLQRFDAVAGGDDLVALAFEPHLQDLDIVGDIVDDEDQRRITHFGYPASGRNSRILASNCRGLNGFAT